MLPNGPITGRFNTDSIQRKNKGWFWAAVDSAVGLNLYPKMDDKPILLSLLSILKLMADWNPIHQTYVCRAQDSMCWSNWFRGAGYIAFTSEPPRRLLAVAVHSGGFGYEVNIFCWLRIGSVRHLLACLASHGHSCTCLLVPAGAWSSWLCSGSQCKLSVFHRVDWSQLSPACCGFGLDIRPAEPWKLTRSAWPDCSYTQCFAVAQRLILSVSFLGMSWWLTSISML